MTLQYSTNGRYDGISVLIFFWDYINSNGEARKQYNNLKMAFLNNKNGRINEYTDYKEQFVQGIYNQRKQMLD
ncbi:GrpB family protein [Bacillus sp. FJAT-49736]|nr:GrpB family protein [Bacillus sp. FJAT-49736]